MPTSARSKRVRKRDLIKKGLTSKDTSLIPHILVLFIGLVILASSFFLVGVYAGRNSDKFPFIVKDMSSDEASIVLVVRGDVEITANKISVTTPWIEWFSERPERNTGVISVAALIASWDSWGFTADPPNAALSNSDLILELTDPEFINETGKLEFEYQVLAGEARTGMLGDLSLFIDAIPTAVNDQITDYTTSGGTNQTYEVYCSVSVEGVAYKFQPVVQNADPWFLATDCKYWNDSAITLINEVNASNSNGHFAVNVNFNLGHPEEPFNYACNGSVQGSLAAGNFWIVNGLCGTVKEDKYGHALPQISLGVWK